MLATNRQAEVRPEYLRKLLESEDFYVKEVVDYRTKLNGILEGTGSIVKDHINSTIYASLSSRCEWEALKSFKDMSSWNIGCCFESSDRRGYLLFIIQMYYLVWEINLLFFAMKQSQIKKIVDC